MNSVVILSVFSLLIDSGTCWVPSLGSVAIIFWFKNLFWDVGVYWKDYILLICLIEEEEPYTVSLAPVFLCFGFYCWWTWLWISWLASMTIC